MSWFTTAKQKVVADFEHELSQLESQYTASKARILADLQQHSTTQAAIRDAANAQVNGVGGLTAKLGNVAALVGQAGPIAKAAEQSVAAKVGAFISTHWKTAVIGGTAGYLAHAGGLFQLLLSKL